MKPKIITLTRGYITEDVTLGHIQIEGVDHEPIYTLEPPWLNNTRNISCIPKGSYPVSPHVSGKFGRCWHVENVPERTAILIHAGNTVDDTQGCIIPGLQGWQLNGKPAVLQSRKAMAVMREILKDETFFLIIK